ncbi:MAG: YdeI/OmpD-associated family protein, partial [Bacteroidota bacterium]
MSEESKWGMPCYTYQGNNVLMLTAFKEYCSINFFKGALLQDSEGILVKAGENTQAARQMRFTNFSEVHTHGNTLKSYVYEAIEVEKAGLKVVLKKAEEYETPDEFQK